MVQGAANLYTVMVYQMKTHDTSKMMHLHITQLIFEDVLTKSFPAEEGMRASVEWSLRFLNLNKTIPDNIQEFRTMIRNV